MATLTPSVIAQVWGEKIGEATTPAGYPLDVYRSSCGHLSYRNVSTRKAAIDKNPTRPTFYVRFGLYDRIVDSEAEALAMLDELAAKTVRMHARLAATYGKEATA